VAASEMIRFSWLVKLYAHVSHDLLAHSLHTFTLQLMQIHVGWRFYLRISHNSLEDECLSLRSPVVGGLRSRCVCAPQKYRNAGEPGTALLSSALLLSTPTPQRALTCGRYSPRLCCFFGPDKTR